MDEAQVANIFRKRISDYTKQLHTLKRQDNVIAIIRLIIFLAASVTFFYYAQSNLKHSFYSLILFIVPFAWLMKTSLRFESKIKHIEQLIQINRKELEATAEKFDLFDGGKEFINPNHPFVADLDIFGAGSLFQTINRTCTISGKIRLATWLKQPKKSREEILSIQKAIQELTQKLDWRQNYEAIGKLATESIREKEQLLYWLNEPVYFINKRSFKIARFLFPLATGILLLLAIFNTINFNWFFTMFLIQLGFAGFNTKKISHKHMQIGRKFNIIDKYSKLLRHVEKETFEDDHLKHLKHALLVNEKTPSENVRDLAKIIDALDLRFNFVSASLLNGFLLWDIYYIIKLEKWQETFKNEWPAWIDNLSQFDALSSLAGFAYNNYDFTYPSLTDKSFVLKAKDMGHPLISKKNRVVNDFELNGLSQVVILTGANMAGKSTFLRSIGVNMVLAMAGGPVCASNFLLYPIELYTSLRTNDSLQRHESFFFAELKKIKMIIEEYGQDKEVFILLDEILKGTNSKDQHAGSEALIKKFIQLKAVGIIATHDIELANLKKYYPENIITRCFEIETDGDKLIFDYKLKDGVCRVMNASILMRQMGIIDQVSERGNTIP